MRNVLIALQVSIHTVPLDEDYVVYQGLPCEKSEKISEEFANSNECRSLMGKYMDFRRYIEKHSGFKVEKMNEFHDIYDPLSIEYARGLPLPDWAHTILAARNISEYFTALYWDSLMLTTETKKAKVGFLIKEIFDRFKAKTLHQLNPDRSLWIYSGHDNTISNILHALNVYKVNLFHSSLETSILLTFDAVESIFLFHELILFRFYMFHRMDRAFIWSCSNSKTIIMYKCFIGETVPSTFHR